VPRAWASPAQRFATGGGVGSRAQATVLPNAWLMPRAPVRRPLCRGNFQSKGDLAGKIGDFINYFPRLRAVSMMVLNAG